MSHLALVDIASPRVEQPPPGRATPASAPPAAASAVFAPVIDVAIEARVGRDLRAPVARAYGYLTAVMDAYATGDAPRLLQSYNNESGLLTTGFVYDNALAVIAFLSWPTTDNVRRARVIGDSLLLAQRTDAARDGRVRQAYFTGPLVFYGGGPFVPGFIEADAAAPASLFGLSGTTVGDAAWVGLAFAHLYAKTRESRYLEGAAAIGRFIVSTASSPYRHGGFLGGLAADGVTPHQWASTEHNLDCVALFRALASLSGTDGWSAHAAAARSFVEAMWEPNAGFFYTGTQNPATPYPEPASGLVADADRGDPDSINRAVIPADAQTWAYLCLGEYRFSRSLDWAAANLATTDTSSSANNEVPHGYAISGVTFSDHAKAFAGPVPEGAGDNDRDAVWLEGTAQFAAALLHRHRRGRHGCGQGQGALSDRARAATCLANIVSAQTTLGASAGGQSPSPQTVGPTARADGALREPASGGWTGTALPPRGGVVAASSAFDTGFGYGYFRRQHVGATSWFLLAAQGTNPFAV